METTQRRGVKNGDLRVHTEKWHVCITEVHLLICHHLWFRTDLRPNTPIIPQNPHTKNTMITATWLWEVQIKDDTCGNQADISHPRIDWYFWLPIFTKGLFLLYHFGCSLQCVQPSVHTELDSFTVPLHSGKGRLPAVRAMQGDYGHWGLKNSGNSHWSHEPIMQWETRQSQSIFSPIATRLGLCSSLTLSSETDHWQWCGWEKVIATQNGQVNMDEPHLPDMYILSVFTV